MQDNHTADAAARTGAPQTSLPYTWERLRTPGLNNRFRVTTPDGQRAYLVALGGGFERCSCPGFRKYDRCRHLSSLQRALDLEPFADRGDLDIFYGPHPPQRRSGPDLPDESTLALLYACESALNYLHRLRVADLEWRRHGDLREEADNELIPLLRNTIHRSRSGP